MLKDLVKDARGRLEDESQRDDLLRDQHGSFTMLRRAGEADWFSNTARPAPDPRARYAARMQAERALFAGDLGAVEVLWGWVAALVLAALGLWAGIRAMRKSS